jgi:hypothetical protein
MKKTLVALAAVAATGGAFAQATMTGTLGFAYYQSVSSLGAAASGFGTDSNNINFAISEDLEAGMKLSAAVGMDLGVESGAATTGRDMSLTVSTADMGKFTFKNSKGSDYLGQGIAAVGSDYEQDLTGTGGVLGTRSVNDTIGWSLPLSKELTVGVTYSEPTTDSGAGDGASGTTANTADYQRFNTYSLTYKSGPLVADAGFRTYDMPNAQTTNNSTRNRGSASYDLGVAKVGAGWSQTVATYGNTTTDTVIGLSFPLGGVTLSGQWANRTRAGNKLSSADTSLNGKIVNAVYNLSKRTDMFVSYKTYDSSSSSATATPSSLGLGIYHSY